MTTKSLPNRGAFALMSAVSVLSVIGYIVSIKMQQKTSGHVDVFRRFSFQRSDDELKSGKAVFEALLEDGFQPIALTPTCQYETQLNIRRTTRIPAPLDTRDTRLTAKLTSVAAAPATSSSPRRFLGEAPPSVCLEKRPSLESASSFLVPNVVHYVFIGSDFEFRFVAHLSLLSVHRFLRPDQIFIHGDALPTGRWWNETVRQVANVYHVRRNYSNHAPNGQPFKFKAHVSDYIRADILARYGGIYLDPDVLALKSFDRLRRHSFVLGRESDDSVGNGIILSRPRAPFLQLLLEQYWSYAGEKEEWATQSVHNVHKLALIYRHLIHVEERSLNRPNWLEKAQIYDGNYDWRNGSYAIHLWLRLWPKEKVPSNWEDLTHVNTTIGQIAQHIRQPS